MFELSCAVGGVGLGLAPLAYVGPGAGLSMLGALFAVSVLVLFALLSPLLYVVRLIRSLYTRQPSNLQMDALPVPTSKQ